MNVLEQLRRLSTAEDFFKYLDVAFEKRVLDVARLHILRRMGEKLAKEGPDAASGDEGALRSHYRAHLEAAYADFVARSPLQERVFKVLKDAVKEKPKSQPRAFVPLDALERK